MRGGILSELAYILQYRSLLMSLTDYIYTDCNFAIIYSDTYFGDVVLLSPDAYNLTRMIHSSDMTRKVHLDRSSLFFCRYFYR